MSTVVEMPKANAADTRRLYTYAELVAELPESNQPCELWDGELIMSPTPSFNHQKVVFRFQRALYDWVAARKLGEVVGDRSTWSRLRIGDGARRDLHRAGAAGDHRARRRRDRPTWWRRSFRRGGRNRDRIEKRDLYEQHGVKEYWIVDPEAETVDVLELVQGQYELAMRRGPSETRHFATVSDRFRGFGWMTCFTDSLHRSHGVTEDRTAAVSQTSRSNAHPVERNRVDPEHTRYRSAASSNRAFQSGRVGMRCCASVTFAEWRIRKNVPLKRFPQRMSGTRGLVASTCHGVVRTGRDEDGSGVPPSPISCLPSPPRDEGARARTPSPKLQTTNYKLRPSAPPGGKRSTSA